MNTSWQSWARLLRQVPYYGAGVLFVHEPGAGGLDVFLAQRNNRPHRGVWSIVGGGREPADRTDFFATACREASEETCDGIPLEQCLRHYLAGPLHPQELPQWRCRLGVYNWHTYIIRLLAKPPASEWPVRSRGFAREFRDAGWFAVDKLPPLVYPGIPKLIKLVPSS